VRREKDFEDLFASFNKHKVRYCIVGAYALGFHAEPRYTKDMDLLIERTTANAERILRALKDFGFSFTNLKVGDLTRKGNIIQLGYEPVRVDLLTSLRGVPFERAWKQKIKGRYGAQRVFFLGVGDLIKNKKAVGRRQDLADLELLGKKR